MRVDHAGVQPTPELAIGWHPGPDTVITVPGGPWSGTAPIDRSDPSGLGTGPGATATPRRAGTSRGPTTATPSRSSRARPAATRVAITRRRPLLSTAWAGGGSAPAVRALASSSRSTRSSPTPEHLLLRV